MASTAMFKGVMAMQSIVSRYVQEQCQMDMFNTRGGYSADTKIFSNQYLIETVLAWVKSGEIAIPEIQRPFVWMLQSEGFNGFIVSGLPYRLYNYMEKSEYQA